MSKRRTYSNEFKLDVIQQSYQRDNIRELAEELGIPPGLIYAWRSDYKKKPQQIGLSTFIGTELIKLKMISFEAYDYLYRRF